MEAQPAPEGPEKQVGFAVLHCRNCSAVVNNRFCAACGQETRPLPANARELVRNLLQLHFSAEGILRRTLILLLFYPGRLTAEYNAGRRVRFIHPRRLYLSLSVLLFALVKLSNVPMPQISIEGHNYSVTYTLSRGDSDAPATSAQHSAPGANTSQNYHLSTTNNKPGTNKPSSGVPPEQRLAHINPALGDKLKQFIDLPAGKKTMVLANGFFAYVPYAMFCTVPLFALYLKLLYPRPRRRYGEYLVFALHSNAFALIIFGLLTLVPGFLFGIGIQMMMLPTVWTMPLADIASRSFARLHWILFEFFEGWAWVKLALCLWLATWLPLALRRVYGGSRFGTFWRCALLMALHLAVMAGATLVAEFVAIVA